MRYRKIVALTLCCTILFTGCGQSGVADSSDTSVSSNTSTVSTAVTTTEGIDVNLVGDYSENSLDASYDEADATKISLDGDSITVDGDGAAVDENATAGSGDATVTITEKGTYVVSGTLENGQIIVDLAEDDSVHLVLDNADITCSDGAAIVAWSVKNLYLTLAEGSVNTVTDGTVYAEDEANAAIYSKDDLIINGTGSLTVNANYKDGITSKDDLQITGGNITVHAVDDAVVGKDSVSVYDGTLAITCGGDGLKASNTEDTAKGYVVIDGGTFSIDAGDDGIHSETVLVINDGEVAVNSSVEGLESLNIVINDGTIDVTASDDGTNVAGGNDTTSADSAWGGAMGGGMDAAIDGALVINGGMLTVDSGGDGLDSNGSILMTGGTVLVEGPENEGNGAIDYNGSFEMTGGTLVAAGTSGMAQAPSTDSAQASIMANFSAGLAAGTKVTFADADGNELYTFTATKQCNSIVMSSPDIVNGSTYTITAGSESVTATGGDITSATGQMGGGMDKGSRGDNMNGERGTKMDNSSQQNEFIPESDGTSL